MAIEIDGSSHNARQNYDLARDKYLENRGIITIRYSNDSVDDDINVVIKDLRQQIRNRELELNLK